MRRWLRKALKSTQKDRESAFSTLASTLKISPPQPIRFSAIRTLIAFLVPSVSPVPNFTKSSSSAILHCNLHYEFETNDAEASRRKLIKMTASPALKQILQIPPVQKNLLCIEFELSSKRVSANEMTLLLTLDVFPQPTLA